MHSNIYSNNTRSIWTTTLPTISISEKSQFFGSYQSQLHKQQHPDHLQHIKPRPGAIVKLSHRRKSPRTNHMLMQLLNDPIGGLRPFATWRNEMPRRFALVGHWAFALDVLCWENLGVFVDGINPSPIPRHWITSCIMGSTRMSEVLGDVIFSYLRCPPKNEVMFESFSRHPHSNMYIYRSNNTCIHCIDWISAF